MDIVDAIRQAEDQLTELREERDRLKNRLDTVNTEGNRLAELVVALREAAAMFGTDEQKATLEEAGPSEVPDDWSSTGRTVAALRAVVAAERPVGPSDIVEILRTKGRTDDTIHLVSAALAHLFRNHKVGKLGRGQWVPYDKLPGVSTTAPDDSVDRPRLGQVFEGRTVDSG